MLRPHCRSKPSQAMLSLGFGHGVVAFEGNSNVWIVDSKADGLVLPKGGYDLDKYLDMKDCLVRDAEEEARVSIMRSSIVSSSIDDGLVHQFKCKL
ncbi:Nudix domain-containing protein [Colletotrichum higginsianum IMI 349063]|uniref:Nudix domain-containing protein n=1 Tax=Colletotrichum higginsianum (strain IMI 349063) TaxID=759273 RepID=A0A1B7YGS5_COLHI|nr:Nudix domain-containing protein [Colletotrichum higginsianum IMI 349063]OBR11256.1 Nudix domain-containing protein [Colletotrichum higginsianum IMI 349063]